MFKPALKSNDTGKATNSKDFPSGMSKEFREGIAPPLTDSIYSIVCMLQTHSLPVEACAYHTSFENVYARSSKIFLPYLSCGEVVEIVTVDKLRYATKGRLENQFVHIKSVGCARL